jgi:hypothetical protein
MVYIGTLQFGQSLTWTSSCLAPQQGDNIKQGQTKAHITPKTFAEDATSIQNTEFRNCGELWFDRLHTVLTQ